MRFPARARPGSPTRSVAPAPTARLARGARLAAPIALALTLLSCAATAPTLREDPPAPELPAGGQRTVRSSGQDGLEIVTRPEGARVYLDNRYVGLTPLFLDDVAVGRYKIALRRNGYYATSEWVDYGGGYLLYSASLQLITGFLKVDVSPAAAEVRVAAEVIGPGRLHELPVGSHTVRARAFGYQEQTRSVQIEERELTPLQITLQPAPFAVSALRAGHEAFNPRNAGLLGQARVRFQVSGPGTGAVRILDPEGREVFAGELPPFGTWEQSLTWNGRDASGEPLPDGEYRLRLSAAGAEGVGRADAVLALRIDSSIRLAYRSLWSGSAGSLYCPTPDVLPRGTLQLSTFVLGGGGEAGVDVPVDVALRLGLGEAHHFELDVLAGVITGYASDAPLPFFSAAAFKAPLLRFAQGELAASCGAQAKLTWQKAGEDRRSDYSGLSVGLPAALRWGPLTLAACPEVVISAWRVTPAGQEIQTGFYSWLYGRLGLLLDLPPFAVGLSGSFRSLPFQEGWGPDAPFHVGLEGHWLIPGTQLFLTLALATELEAEDGPRLYGGGGLGLLR